MEWFGLSGDLEKFNRLVNLGLAWLVVMLLARTVMERWLKSILLKAQERAQRSALEKKQRAETVVGVVQATVVVGITGALVIEGLATVGFDIGPLIAGAGVVGFAIGFGAQSLVRDVINGLFILIEDQFELGDIVEINSVKGKVVEFNLRRTVLRDDDGVAHHIPNSTIGRVANMTQDWSRLNVVVSVGYQADMEKVEQLLNEAAKELAEMKQFKEVLRGEPKVELAEEMSGGVMKYKLVFKVDAGKQWQLKRLALAEVKRRFDKEKIELK